MTALTWLVPADHQHLTPNRYSAIYRPKQIKPIEGIIYHYTAGAFAPSLNWLLSRASSASAHFIVAKGGDLVQLAPLEDRTWHAGGTPGKPSLFLGTSNVNGRTWGIEIENRGGPLKKPEADSFIDAAGRAWEPFTEAQILTVERLTTELVARMPNADAVRAEPSKYLVGHSAVDAPRKVDPGSAFPWERIYIAATAPPMCR